MPLSHMHGTLSMDLMLESDDAVDAVHSMLALHYLPFLAKPNHAL
jgi:hypothetical protein